MSRGGRVANCEDAQVGDVAHIRPLSTVGWDVASQDIVWETIVGTAVWVCDTLVAPPLAVVTVRTKQLSEPSQLHHTMPGVGGAQPVA